MGGSCSNSVGDVDNDPNLIIDVEKVLADKAWDMFLASFDGRQFVKRKDYKIEVPMNYYHFEEMEREVMARTSRLPGATGLGKHGGESLLSGKGLAHGDQTSPGHIGLETEFNNDTDEKQTYTFEFEKVRTASVNVTYQKGFSIGTKANFTISLPKVLGDGSIGLETNRQLQVTKSTGEKFEESLKTTAKSDIVVSERSKYIASVVMEERALLADFRNVIQMSLPAGKAPVYIKSVKTGEVVSVTVVNNLFSKFRKFKEQVEEVKDAEGKIRYDAVRFIVEGIVDGVQLSSHKINLYSDASVQATEKKTETLETLGTVPMRGQQDKPLPMVKEEGKELNHLIE